MHDTRPIDPWRAMLSALSSPRAPSPEPIKPGPFRRFGDIASADTPDTHHVHPLLEQNENRSA